MDVWIRQGGLGDVGRAAALEAGAAAAPAKGRPAPAPPEALEAAWRAFLLGDELATLHLGEDETGAPVGFAAGGSPREGALGWDAELRALLVVPRARRRGLGSGLLRRTLGQLAALGCSSAGLWLPLEGDAARAFCRRLGGREVGERVAAPGGGGAASVEVAALFDELVA